MRSVRNARGAKPAVPSGAAPPPGGYRARVRVKGVGMPTSGSILGNAVRRLEDPTLLTGDGKYVDDLVEPGTLHVAFVRSPVAHANVGSVDIADLDQRVDKRCPQ